MIKHRHIATNFRHAIHIPSHIHDPCVRPHTHSFQPMCLEMFSDSPYEIILQLSFSYGNFTRSFAFPSPQSGRGTHPRPGGTWSCYRCPFRGPSDLRSGPGPSPDNKGDGYILAPNFYSPFPFDYFLTLAANQQRQRKTHNGPIVQCLITFVRRYSLWYDMPRLNCRHHIIPFLKRTLF